MDFTFCCVRKRKGNKTLDKIRISMFKNNEKTREDKTVQACSHHSH